MDVCCPLPSRKQIIPFKNLPLSFSFAESAVLRLEVNCKTFFVVILNGICLLALNIRVNFFDGKLSYGHVFHLLGRFTGYLG